MLFEIQRMQPVLMEKKPVDVCGRTKSARGLPKISRSLIASVPGRTARLRHIGMAMPKFCKIDISVL